MGNMLLTQPLRAQLLANGAASAKKESDHQPVVKLFHPMGSATWLLSELDADGDRAFGLCDLGQGTPELGYVSLTELANLRVRGLPVERDLYFTANRTLTGYAAVARGAGKIVA